MSEVPELPTQPKGMESKTGQGFEAAGQVYRDPEPGMLIMIGE
ncbi:hypothetical protein GCM10011352_01160 [Marinobacterium zhoushanense]|uniref:Uncharacterized protein n=1 Tax=Marinobacterium zhoushanense TaxID=1679163 RepID=A0ABQ1JZU1_9GAMM|nr:hypothetical protein [Marinobacterium zhoushanense]GGB79272.1 hypothetical protein GCM10011352_01160 [Marinobacterium zhoushanense]